MNQADGAHYELDPELDAILSQDTPNDSLDVDVMRREVLEGKRFWNDMDLAGLTIEDREVLGGNGPRPLRIFSPDGFKGPPIFYVHGGGWTMCDLDTHHAVFVFLARLTGRRVYALHARRSPESPYPAALDDVVSGLRNLQESWPDGCFLAGDSAGANLALAAALRSRDQGLDLRINALVLYYGCFRRLFDTSSHKTFGDGRFGLTTEKMQRFWSYYKPDASNAAYADLRGHGFASLPPVQLHAATLDPLLDDSLWLHERLGGETGGVPLHLWEGVTHGFLHYPKGLTKARQVYSQTGAFLNAVSP